jgi:hypothetical protein
MYSAYTNLNDNLLQEIFQIKLSHQFSLQFYLL